MNQELKGGYKLTAEIIDQEVPGAVIGNYLLSEGLRSAENRLIVTYVGRSTDLNRRLKEHLQDKEHYVWFWYRPAEDEYQSYVQECHDYHDYSRVHALNNEIHPAKIKATDKCPECGD